MGSSRMIATRQRAVFMSHICSKCGFPLISIVQIESESQKTYTLFQEKAGKIASDTAEKAIEDEIRRIESCRKDRTVLVGKLKKGSMISPGYFCDSSFTGHQTRCPYCGNIEPWKTASPSEKAMEELVDANFPVVFKDSSDAVNWAKDRVMDIVQSINNQRTNADLVSGATSRAVSIRRDLDRYLELSKSIPEKAQLAQLNDLEKRKEQLGLLDIKGKKEVGSAIKITELKIADISKTIAAKDTPFLDQIQANRQRLLYAQAVAFGCSDTVISLRYENAFSYQYVANDIPEELMAETSTDIDERISEGKMREEVSGTHIEESSVPLFCRKCGYRLLQDSVFCTKCGTRV